MRPPKKYRRRVRAKLRYMPDTVFVQMVGGASWRWRFYPEGRVVARRILLERRARGVDAPAYDFTNRPWPERALA